MAKDATDENELRLLPCLAASETNGQSIAPEVSRVDHEWNF